MVLNIFKKHLTLENLKKTTVDILKLCLGDLGYMANIDYWIDVANVNGLYAIRFKNEEIKTKVEKHLKRLTTLKESKQALNELRTPTSFEDLKTLFIDFEQTLLINRRTAREATLDRLINLLEYGTNDPNIDIEKLTRTNKFTILGSGTFAVTFKPISTKQRNYAVKVWIQDPAYDFVASVIKHNQNKKDIYVPKIIWGPKMLFTAPNGDKIQCMVMEELYPLRGEIYNDIDFIGYSIQGAGYLTPLENIINDITHGSDELPDAVQQRRIDLITKIYPTLKKFYKSGSDFDWDVHTGNLMLRADGTLLVTDPLYHPRLA